MTESNPAVFIKHLHENIKYFKEQQERQVAVVPFELQLWVRLY